MHPLQKQKAVAELLWWIFTLLVIAIVLFPIWDNDIAFPFYFQNALLVALFITFTRYIFLLPLTFIARMKWIKVAIIGVAAIFFFVMTTALGDFRSFMDEKGLQSLTDHLHVNQQTSIIEYIKDEMIFFGVGSIITGLILPARMIMSLWRMRNEGTV